MEERREEESQQRSDSVWLFILGVAVLAIAASAFVIGYFSGTSATYPRQCDVYFVVPHGAGFPVWTYPIRVCYVEENVPYPILICPTKYSLAVRAFPELNVDALKEANTWCANVRAYVDSLSPGAVQEVSTVDQNA